LPFWFDRVSGMVEGVKTFLNPKNAQQATSEQSTQQRKPEQRKKLEQRERIRNKKQELSQLTQELSQLTRVMYAAKDEAEQSERIKRAIKKKLELFELKNELRSARRGWTVPRMAGGAQTGALPDFAVIGAAKSGTTFLYHLLTQHPLVQPAAFKEPHYFNFVFEDEGVEWYRRCFPQPRWVNGRRAITGEASPGYLFHPLVPERMAQVVPQVRLIALLRNPVDRTFSAYNWRLRYWQETRTFEEVIEANRDGDITSLSRSIYIEHLMRWREFFDKEQMLVLKSEDFFENPKETLEVVLEFLDLPEWAPDASELEGGKRNAGRYEQRMDPATRRRLEEYFEPHNQRLYDFLGTDFGW
jgi:hypothetical protein